MDDRDRVREKLIGWRLITAQRDDLVREANKVGIPILEIQRLTGIGRNTIYRILDPGEEKQ